MLPLTHCSFPHHKNTWSWNRPLRGVFPREVSLAVFKPYLLAARPQLVNGGQESFFLGNSGAAFSGPGLTIAYSNM